MKRLTCLVLVLLFIPGASAVTQEALGQTWTRFDLDSGTGFDLGEASAKNDLVMQIYTLNTNSEIWVAMFDGLTVTNTQIPTGAGSFSVNKILLSFIQGSSWVLIYNKDSADEFWTVSHNDGTTWSTPINVGVIPLDAYDGIYIHSATTWSYTTNSGSGTARLRFTTDSGLTWTLVTCSLTFGASWIGFDQDFIGVGPGVSGNFLSGKSTDQCASTTQLADSGTITGVGRKVKPNQNGWLLLGRNPPLSGVWYWDRDDLAVDDSTVLVTDLCDGNLLQFPEWSRRVGWFSFGCSGDGPIPVAGWVLDETSIIGSVLPLTPDAISVRSPSAIFLATTPTLAVDEGDIGYFWLGEPIDIPVAESGLNPSEFDTGLKAFFTGLGFRSPESQLFVVLILVGLISVIVAAGSKLLPAGRWKAMTIMVAQVLVGIFGVILLWLQLWMFVLAMVLGVAIVQGAGELRNSLREIQGAIGAALAARRGAVTAGGAVAVMPADVSTAVDEQDTSKGAEVASVDDVGGTDTETTSASDESAGGTDATS